MHGWVKVGAALTTCEDWSRWGDRLGGHFPGSAVLRVGKPKSGPGENPFLATLLPFTTSQVCPCACQCARRAAAAPMHIFVRTPPGPLVKGGCRGRAEISLPPNAGASRDRLLAQILRALCDHQQSRRAPVSVLTFAALVLSGDTIQCTPRKNFVAYLYGCATTIRNCLAACATSTMGSCRRLRLVEGSAWNCNAHVMEAVLMSSLLWRRCSYPTMIPLPASEVEKIKCALSCPLSVRSLMRMPMKAPECQPQTASRRTSIPSGMQLPMAEVADSPASRGVCSAAHARPCSSQGEVSEGC